MAMSGGSAVRKGTMGCSVLASVAGMIVLGWTIMSGETMPGGWNVAGVTFDGLTAFFLFMLFLGQGIASLYGSSYMKEYEDKRPLGLFSLSWIIFLGSMAGVLLVRDGFYFLFFWEVMSLASFLLVLFEHEERSNRKAAFIYLVMTHMGTVFLTCAVLYLYSKTGSFAFAAWRDFSPSLTLLEKNLLFVCLLIGLGTKAGLVPFHIWLPYAHPVAPSPVSALMSGLMVKVALYMILRLVWLTLGVSVAWWGWVLLGLGVLSALVGILYASVEQDIKRLLAYSTVENVGILAIALGTAMLAQAKGHPGFAQLALGAFFWHALQHLLFKSTMFMAAGNLIQATHIHRLEQMGGLLRRLPRTGFWALLAAFGLSALPPLGGFWGEWLLCHSLWATSLEISEVSFKLVLPMVIAVLGLVSALALATMVKWYAGIFLGQPRSSISAQAVEVSKYQTLPLGLAMGVAVLSVIFPGWMIQLISYPVVALSGIFTVWPGSPPVFGTPEASSPILFSILSPSAFSSFYTSVTLFALLWILLSGGLYLLIRGRRRRVAPTWNCGAPLTPRMQYTGMGITMPLRIFFKQMIGSTPVIEREYGENHYILRNLRYQGKTQEVYEEKLYRPLTRIFMALAERIQALQTGSIHLYLGYMLITLVLVLGASMLF